MNLQYRNTILLSDRSGTAMWRRMWPTNSINCIALSINTQVDYSLTPIIDLNYYRGVNSITVQRWISKEQCELFCKFYKPIMDANCGWTIYEIDDLMYDGDSSTSGIPYYNRGRAAFEGTKVLNSIKTMLNTTDFVTVTTDYIKLAYNKIYGVPLENIIAIPNLLPKYLFGDRYDVDKRLNLFRLNKSKPRVGIISSLSHYNIDDVREDINTGKPVRKQKDEFGNEKWFITYTDENELIHKIEIPESQTKIISDDLDEIIDTIKDTINDFQWVFFGYCPSKLQKYVDEKKIEVHVGVPIMNYASMIDKLNLQCVIAPIKDMEFNRCKSFIKYMECAAIGVPLFASNYLPYNRVMPKNLLFNSSSELTDMLRKLKFMSVGIYQDIIERQWKWLNTPCHEGDYDLNNFWLEDNLNIWIDLFRLRNKTLNISYTNFEKQYLARKQQDAEKIIYKNDNITITK